MRSSKKINRKYFIESADFVLLPQQGERMGKISFLLIGLGISLILYFFYRYIFLRPKKKLPQKESFTFKIESE
jgi:hypothetical protein